MKCSFERQSIFRPWLAVALCLAALFALAGCGGGGGGNSGPNTVSITGKLVDKSNNNAPLANRTVTVQGQNLQAITDNNGQFTIGSVPVGNITLTITDSAGTSDGTYSVNLNNVSGNPKNLGTIQLDTSGGPPPPPI